MKPIKIFIASSEELKYERLVIAELVTRLNYYWHEYGYCIRLIKWEYLDSSMSTQHKQEDYNDELRQCDACIILFWNKLGMYTKIELDTASDLFNSERCLVQIGVLFKESNEISPELKHFKENYQTEHPEQCYTFIGEDDLKDLFIQQVLECIKRKLSEEQHYIEKQIKRKQKFLSVTDKDETIYQEYVLELQHLEELLTKNGNILPTLMQSLHKK